MFAAFGTYGGGRETSSAIAFCRVSRGDPTDCGPPTTHSGAWRWPPAAIENRFFVWPPGQHNALLRLARLGLTLQNQPRKSNNKCFQSWTAFTPSGACVVAWF